MTIYEYIGLFHSKGRLVAALFFQYRKDLKFVSEVEEEMKNLVELVNKVRNANLTEATLLEDLTPGCHPTPPNSVCCFGFFEIRLHFWTNPVL